MIRIRLPANGNKKREKYVGEKKTVNGKRKK